MDKIDSYFISANKDGIHADLNLRELGSLKVKGQALEAQFNVSKNRDLVITNDNCPYEEAIHFYLIDSTSGLTILDEMHAGVIYNTGIYKTVRTEANKLFFNFYGKETVYELQVLESKSICIFTEKGFRYGNFFRKHYLTLIAIETCNANKPSS